MAILYINIKIDKLSSIYNKILESFIIIHFLIFLQFY